MIASKNSDASRPVIVIGSGLAGLTAACTLAARGKTVRVFEKNEWIGGKAAVLNEAGYRFDMGPTILTLPSVLRRVFAEANRDLDDYLTLLPLDPQWRCFFEGGSTLDLVRNVDDMADRLQSFSAHLGDDVRYRKFLQKAEHLHELSERYFFWRSVGSLTDALSTREALRPGVVADLWRLRPGQTVAGMVRRHALDSRVAQMLDHFVQYVGSAPDTSPAVLCGIAHMQTEEGVWYPLGGTGAVPAALEKLARELGVEFCTEQEVDQIVTENSVVQGVRTSDGTTHEASAVVSNEDAVRTFRELLPADTSRSFLRRRRYEPACSGVVLYLGLREKYNHLLHHNFVFSRDPHEEFEQIYRQGQPADDPTCYVCAPSESEPATAPAGGEALYVLVHAPYLRDHHDWQEMFPAYRQKILNKLASTGGMSDIESRIEFESFLTPADIHRRYQVLNGAIYGIASHGAWLGAFKPANRNTDVAGLYLAGGAAHPGPGMPMVMMSGWIAADALTADFPQATHEPQPRRTAAANQ